jgi:transposase, IS30 family
LKYQQLTQEERYQIASYIAIGLSKTAIAAKIGKNRSTVFREIKRNLTDSGFYRPKTAQKKYDFRRKPSGEKARKIKGHLLKLVELKLAHGWSPEQISGRLWLEDGIHISHETIYQHIIRDTHEKRGPLRYYLRFRGYKQHRYKKSRYAERSRMRKHHIDDRCDEANNREKIGHWERDLVEGAKAGASLLTLIDRKSRLLKVRWVRNKTVQIVAKQTEIALKNLKVKTMTNDNGSEFGNCEPLQKALKAPIYYTDPCSPWQRGSIENINGLVRQYFLKRTALEEYPRWITKALEETFNHRPRKTLDYRTPHEVFFNKQTSILQSHFGLKFGRST